MNISNMKRILSLLLVCILLCCCVLRPVSASAASVVAGAGALLVGITPEIAVSALLTALGITYLTQVDYEAIVSNIAQYIPDDYLLAAEGYSSLVGAVTYDDICYVSQEFAEWVSSKIWTESDSNTALVTPTYEFSNASHGEVYTNCINWLKSAYPSEVSKCQEYKYSYVCKGKDLNGSIYQVCAFSDAEVSFMVDENGYLCKSCADEGMLIFISDAYSNISSWNTHDAGWTKIRPVADNHVGSAGERTLVLIDGLAINGTIAYSLDDEIYAGWTGRAITLANSQTLYLPISVADTVAGTGSLSQTIAQTGEVFVPSSITETEEEIPVVDIPVVGNDLLGIITLLKSILTALNNIYRVVSTNIKSWWDNATTTIALNIASLGTAIGEYFDTLGQNLQAWWNEATTKVISAIETIPSKIEVFISTLGTTITTAISNVGSLVQTVIGTLADILEWVIALPQAIAEAIAEVLSAIFVPSNDFLTEKVNALREHFAFADSVLGTFQLIKTALDVSTSPPIIYIDLSAATGSYIWGPRTIFLDLTWYSAYKPTVDILLSAFMWIWFIWRFGIHLPDYIRGTGAGNVPEGTATPTDLTVQRW